MNNIPNEEHLQAEFFNCFGDSFFKKGYTVTTKIDENGKFVMILDTPKKKCLEDE